MIDRVLPFGSTTRTGGRTMAPPTLALYGSSVAPARNHSAAAS